MSEKKRKWPPFPIHYNMFEQRGFHPLQNATLKQAFFKEQSTSPLMGTGYRMKDAGKMPSERSLALLLVFRPSFAFPLSPARTRKADVAFSSHRSR